MDVRSLLRSARDPSIAGDRDGASLDERRYCLLATTLRAARPAVLSPGAERVFCISRNSHLFLEPRLILLRVLRLLTPCRGATIRLSTAVAQTTEARPQPPRHATVREHGRNRVPFHGRAAQRDCHRACVCTRYFSVEPYTERAGLDGTVLVILSTHQTRAAIAASRGRRKSRGPEKFRSDRGARCALAVAVGPSLSFLSSCGSALPTRRSRYNGRFLPDRFDTEPRGPPPAAPLVCSFLSREPLGPT